MVFDCSGNLYVTNKGNDTVSKFVPGATTPSATLNGLDSPTSLAFDSRGNLYVVDQGQNGNGTTVSMFNPGATVPSATLTGLNYPQGLAFDGSGNLYVVNRGNNTVAKFSPSGLQGNDTVTATEVFSDANAGTDKTLSISAYTVNDGNNENNYPVTTLANTTGVVRQAPLTITAQTNTKTYDSTTIAAAVPMVTGLQGNDNVVSGLLYVVDSSARVVAVDAVTGSQRLIASGGYLTDPTEGIAVLPNGDLVIADRGGHA